MKPSVKHMAPSRCSVHVAVIVATILVLVLVETLPGTVTVSSVMSLGWLFINIAGLLISLSLIIINNHKNDDTQTASQDRSAAVSCQNKQALSHRPLGIPLTWKNMTQERSPCPTHAGMCYLPSLPLQCCGGHAHSVDMYLPGPQP